MASAAAAAAADSPSVVDMETVEPQATWPTITVLNVASSVQLQALGHRLGIDVSEIVGLGAKRGALRPMLKKKRAAAAAAAASAKERKNASSATANRKKRRSASADDGDALSLLRTAASGSSSSAAPLSMDNGVLANAMKNCAVLFAALKQNPDAIKLPFMKPVRDITLFIQQDEAYQQLSAQAPRQCVAKGQSRGLGKEGISRRGHLSSGYVEAQLLPGLTSNQVIIAKIARLMVISIRVERLNTSKGKTVHHRYTLWLMDREKRVLLCTLSDGEGRRVGHTLKNDAIVDIGARCPAFLLFPPGLQLEYRLQLLIRTLTVVDEGKGGGTNITPKKLGTVHPDDVGEWLGRTHIHTPRLIAADSSVEGVDGSSATALSSAATAVGQVGQAADVQVSSMTSNSTIGVEVADTGVVGNGSIGIGYTSVQRAASDANVGIQNDPDCGSIGSGGNGSIGGGGNASTGGDVGNRPIGGDVGTGPIGGGSVTAPAPAAAPLLQRLQQAMIPPSSTRAHVPAGVPGPNGDPETNFDEDCVIVKEQFPVCKCEAPPTTAPPTTAPPTTAPPTTVPLIMLINPNPDRCVLGKCFEPICDSYALRSLDPIRDFSIICKGETCSDGVRFFRRCISKLIDPAYLCPDMLFLNYPFGTKPSPMTNEAMRAALYYYYATQVYMAFGKWRRVELPFCLVSRIRHLFPNKKGDKYRGHKDVTLADMLGF